MAIRGWALAPGLTGALFGIAAWMQPAAAACPLQEMDPIGRLGVATVPGLHSAAMPWSLLTDTFCWHPPGAAPVLGPVPRATRMSASAHNRPVPREIVHRGVTRVVETTRDGSAALAVGLRGSPWPERIVNEGTIDVHATAGLARGSVSLTLAGGDEAADTTSIAARATGIAGGAGDTLDNRGTVSAVASASVDHFDAELNLIDLSHGDTRLTVAARAIGIDAAADAVHGKGIGPGSSAILNSGQVTARADASAGRVGVELNAVDAASADSSVAIAAAATGLRGGHGTRFIDNRGTLHTAATATLGDVGVTASFLDATVVDGQEETRLPSTVTAAATGIDASRSAHGLTLKHSGTLRSGASASAHATEVSVTSEGLPDVSWSLPFSDPPDAFGVESRARTIGILAGGGDDRLTIAGSIAASATSNATQESINVGIAVLDLKLPTLARDLSNAGTSAGATATGVDAGSGHDAIVADGRLSANATAKASATTVAVDIAELSLDLLPGVPSIPFGISLVVTDTATEASATSTGITAGSGNDSLLHRGTLRSTAGATSGSTSAAASLNMAYGKGDNTLAVDVIAARAVTEATAGAVGLDGGSGRDRLRHEGSATVAAGADALAVSAIVDVAGTLKGKGGAVSGALTDSSARGTATATGLQGGEGDDTLAGSGALDVSATANVDAVSVSTTIGIVQQGLVAGATLSRSSSTATAHATGVDGGAGRNLIVQSGPLNVTAGAEADAVSVSLTLAGTAKGIEGGAALADAHTTASAAAVGIRSGSEAAAPVHHHDANDAHKAQNNGGCAPCTPPAMVTHSGTMVVNAQADADAVGVGATLGVAKTGVALGAALARTGSTSSSSAVGIQGDGADDTVVNSGRIGLRSVADGDAVSVALTVEGTASGLAAGAALAHASVNATAGATGIAGGGGNDRLFNSGSIGNSTVAASATAVSVAASVLVAKEGAALGAALSDTSATATANLRGLDGGEGRDGLANEGRITLRDASADATAVGVSLQVALAKEGLAAGAALARSDSVARLTAAGLDGGSGDDALLNKGSVTLERMASNADAVSVAATISGAKDGVALGASLSSATGNASTVVRAIDAGSGNDQVLNRGTLTASGIGAEADAAGISVTLTGTNAGVAAGVTLADTSATARAEASGLHGGDGRDELWNDGRITLRQVTADADAVGVGVSLTAAINGVAGGAALGRANARASVRATAIDGGAGNDLLVNRGRIVVDGIDADTDAVGVTAQIGITNNGVAAGAALADTAAGARVDARGLDGGSGDDRLDNTGTVTLRNLRAQADAVSVGVTVNAALSAGVAAGVALTDGSGTAHLRARGLAGGDGNDLLVNRGTLRIENALADAQAAGVSVTLNASLAGLAAGAAVADTSATARTEVSGLSGDAGNDLLHNTGRIEVAGEAKAGALAVSVQVSGAVGVAAGAAITDASSTASSTVLGIEGGAGRDALLNEGSVHAQSTAGSRAAAISASLSAGFGADVTLADARSTATASAVGLHDSAGAPPPPPCGHGARAAQANCSRNGGSHPGDAADRIDNRGAVSADAVATARGTSVSGSLRGYALGETTNSATASAAGIQSHDSHDLIRNAGAITSTGSARTEGLSVAVTLAGASFGDASSTATARAAGIDSGAGHDQVANLAAIGVDARSQARATTVTVGLIGVAQADASTTALASARGIDAGAGDDAVLNLGGVTANAGLPRLRRGNGLCSEASGGACVTASTVAVTLAGAGSANAAGTAAAAAIGLDGGEGRDRLDNRAAVNAGALARGMADAAAVTLLGAASADAGTSIRAQATGLDGGRGDDSVSNTAAVRSEAAAESVTRGMSFTVAGRSRSAASSLTEAAALGLGGGEGRDSLFNAGSGRVTVRANTEASVTASAWTFAGAASSQATVGARTDAVGIDGGAGGDWIESAGIVDVLTGSVLSARGGATAIFGGASAGSTIGATTMAVGIAASDDADKVVNRGSISATARARMSAQTIAASFAGSAATTEFVTAAADATAIDTGAGDDAVLNDGSARAEVGAVARTDGSSSTDLGGDAQASGTVAASAAARGIDGGTGHAWVHNRGSVAAIVSSQSWATHSSDSGVFFSDAGVVASSATRLAGTGIRLGDGHHGVKNSGSIAVTGSTGAGDWNGDGRTEGTFARAQADGGDFDIFTGDGDAAGTATARAAAALDGISLGSGHSQVRNEGRISVRSGPDGLKALADVVGNGGAVTVDGDAAGWATASMTSTARGIAAGGGRVELTNTGSIAIDVAPAAAGHVDAEAGSSGDTDVFVDARVDSRAFGVQLGAGRHHGVFNTGTVGVVHAASASAFGRADGEGADGDGRVGFGIALSGQPGLARVNAFTTGIEVGGSEAWIAQKGRVVLVDTASASATANADSDFTGDANAFARGEVTGSLHGLRTRGEGAWILNAGTLRLSATPRVDSVASGRASGDGSRAWGTAIALSQADTRLRGIGAEGAGSQVLNTGTVDIDAALASTSRGEAESNLDAHSQANATAAATVRGVGIDASGGGAAVEQRGNVDVRVSGDSRATTWSSADGALARTRAIAESVARAEAQAIGLRVADAGGAVLQAGLITASGRASTATVTDTDAPGLPKGVENNYSLASASAYGLSLGTTRAKLWVENTGTIRVAASATATAVAEGSTYMHTEELASARAFGIVGGGSAATTVLNSGRIVATAVASSDWNDLGQAPVAEAVAIRTGSGHDTVVQTGSILTTQRTPAGEVRGTAIATGAGNDRVLLGDGSVTEGHIDLGTGHDTLTLQGTPVVHGSIAGGRSLSSTPGSLTLQLIGEGRFAGDVPAHVAIKTGPGTYSLASLRTLDRIEAREGTLALDSGYTMAAGSQFAAAVRGDGSHGQLHVRGEARLAGRMTVVDGGGAFVDGSTYDVLKADGGIRAGTAFAAIELPAPTLLLSFDARQLRDRVRITADVQSFTTVAKNAGQRALAQQLDRIVPLSSGELRHTLGAIQRLNSEPEFGAAFDSLDPAVHARRSQASLSGPRKHARTLHDRMTALRIGQLATPDGAPSRLALAGGDDPASGRGLWKTSFTLQGGQGERHDVDGLALGFDRRLGENLSAGVSFAHAANELQPDAARIGLEPERSRVRSGLAAVYGEYFDSRWHVGGTLATGRNDYESRRSITIGTLGASASSNHRGTVTAASLEAGYLLPAGRGWLDPYLHLQHTQVAEQGFSEAGGAAAGLVVSARRTRELLSTLGVRWSQVFERGHGAFVTPELGIGWLHDFSRTPAIRAAFAGAPAAGFTVEGAPVQRDGAVLGLGLNYRTRGGTTGSIRYSGELRRGEATHGVVGELRVEF